MTAVQYDLDTSGGLMEQIQALIAPPVCDEPPKKQRRIDRDRRRTGRAINRDTCDSCREGGDLLCCDRCPAAFHLTCCDPPLEEDDLPRGEWLCHQCTVSPKEGEESSFNISRADKDKDKMLGPGRPVVKLVPMRLNDRLMAQGKSCMRLVQLQAYEEAKKEQEGLERQLSGEPAASDIVVVEQEEYKVPEDFVNPFDVLVKAAAMQNPKQFSVPPEFMTNAPLPGSSRRKRKEDAFKKKPYELENGMVPLPAKLCFKCKKSCRVAPLIQCDFCPLLFHQDCLDPPLTMMPTGRWMCPNHPENYVPEFFSESYTERCRIYNQFHSQVQQNAVKIKFLNKIHSSFKPNKGIITPQRKKMKVPDSIKAQYARPPHLLPRPYQRPFDQSTLPPEKTHCTPEEAEDWLRSVVLLQSSIARYIEKKKLPKDRIKPKIITVSSLNKTSSGAGMKNIKIKGVNIPSHTPHINNTLHNGQDGNVIGKSEKTQPTQNGITCTDLPNGILNVNKHENKGHDNVINITGNPSSSSIVLKQAKQLYSLNDTNRTTTNVNSLSKGNISAVKVFPGTKYAIRINTLSVGSGKESLTNNAHNTSGQASVKPNAVGTTITKITPASLSSSPAIINLNASLQSCIDGDTEVELSQLDEKLIQILAFQRLQQLVPSKNQDTSKKPPPNTATSVPVSTPPIKNVLRARATLTSVSNRANKVDMWNRSLNIGTGSEMHVCLTKFGHCNYVSPKHACIFFNEASKQFELHNYSEHGTIVDNVVYSGDVINRQTPDCSSKGFTIIPMDDIQNVKTKQLHNDEMKPRMYDISGNFFHKPCNCKSKNSNITDAGSGAGWKDAGCGAGWKDAGCGAGWKGTAVLHQGSSIQFGCLKFVFSLTEACTLLDKSATEKPSMFFSLPS